MRRAWDTWLGLLRAGFAAAIAYRAEFFVWFLSTNMPLIMWLLFSTVAAEAPVGHYNAADFGRYFLVTLIVRLLTGAWVAWQLNEEVREGVIAQRLLRPVHPFIAFAAENLSAFPLRIVMLTPVLVVAAIVVGANGFSSSPTQIALGLVSIGLAWALQFSAQLLIGTLALYWQNAVSLLELWLGMYFVFSGYLMPLDLFPPWLLGIVRLLPFPYLLGHPVEALLGLVSVHQTLLGLAIQATYVCVFTLCALVLFRFGLRRYQVFGG